MLSKQLADIASICYFVELLIILLLLAILVIKLTFVLIKFFSSSVDIGSNILQLHEGKGNIYRVYDNEMQEYISQLNHFHLYHIVHHYFQFYDIYNSLL